MIVHKYGDFLEERASFGAIRQFGRAPTSHCNGRCSSGPRRPGVLQWSPKELPDGSSSPGSGGSSTGCGIGGSDLGGHQTGDLDSSDLVENACQTATEVPGRYSCRRSTSPVRQEPDLNEASSSIEVTTKRDAAFTLEEHAAFESGTVWQGPNSWSAIACFRDQPATDRTAHGPICTLSMYTEPAQEVGLGPSRMSTQLA